MTTTTRNLDAQAIKRQASGQWKSILSSLGGIELGILDGSHHPCPKCGGDDRFRLIDEDAGAILCNQCFAENNGDGLAALQWITGKSFRDVLAEIADYLGIGGNGHLSIVEDIARRKRVPLKSWLAFGATEAKRGKLTVCRMPMFDEHGRECSSTDFATIGQKWLKGIAAKGKPTGLFLKAETVPMAGETVHIVEGPKDAAALHGLGFEAVGLPTSAMAEKFARLFRGVHVVIIPDRDEPGEAGSEKTAGRLAGVAASVRIATLPGELKESGGDDIRDILTKQNGEEHLRQAIQDAVEWKPDSDSGNGQPSEPTASSADGLAIDFLQNRNDIANARRFVRKFGIAVRYCKSSKSWYVWNDAIWKLDDTDEVFRMAKTVSDDLWQDARKSENEKVLGFAAQSAGERSIRAMISLAASEPGIPILADDLDSDPWLLSCPNGTIDLQSGELRLHRQADLITMLCPTEYHPDASTYEWDRFLESLFDNDDMIQFLKRWFGYCLTGNTSEQILAIFHGCGCNGKSTLLNAIRETMGRQFCMQAVSDFLMAKKQERHSTEKADLFRVRLALCAETGSGRYLDDNLVKEQTGEESIRARRMRENFFEFTPSHKLIISTNHRPRVRDNDHAIWRRLALITFGRTFWNPDKPGESGPLELKIDKQLGKKLAENREGILAWMVEGCLEWQRNGLRVPKVVSDATDEYRTQEDVIGQFIEDRCIIAQNCEVKFKSFYDALEEWCNDSGENLPSRKKVGSVLIERKFQRKLNRGKSYAGIGLKSDPRTDDTDCTVVSV